MAPLDQVDHFINTVYTDPRFRPPRPESTPVAPGGPSITLVGAKGEVSTAAAHASEWPLPVFLASPPSKACAMRSPASSEHACPTRGLLCGRLLVALAESVLID